MILDMIFISLCDMVSCGFSKVFLPHENIHHNSRWFFIHFFINVIITCLTVNDLMFCIEDYTGCYLETSSPQAFYGMRLAVLLHIYHMIVFTNKLTHRDWVHHLSLCAINLPSLYIYNKKLHGAGTFFLTGLPGAIDYFLLWCVKMKLIDPMIEKRAYIHISTWLRSPGCMFVTFLTKDFFIYSSSLFDKILISISIILNFWNGQYYQMITCIDYGKKLK
jgi:hypothetical protein